MRQTEAALDKQVRIWIRSRFKASLNILTARMCRRHCKVQLQGWPARQAPCSPPSQEERARLFRLFSASAGLSCRHRAPAKWLEVHGAA
jgi:hypothetical protein